MPNPWDVGSARLLEALGFRALATTSGGHAAALGRVDGEVSRAEALAHGAALVAAVVVPVSADLENGFGDDPSAVADTVAGAATAGLAGCSIEDYAPGSGIYGRAHAADRVRAAAQAAAATGGIVLTARAENFIRGRPDLADTIARLQAYQEAGADVLYAPGISSLDDVRAVVSSVDRPVNVLVVPGLPSVADLAQEGVARVSVGAAFALVAAAALAQAAGELLAAGTYGWLDAAARGREVVPRRRGTHPPLRRP